MVNDCKLRVNLKREVDDSYDIHIGENLFPQIASYLRDAKLGSRYAIITDSNVRELYAGSLEDCLRKEGLHVTTFSFPAGEHNKTEDNSDDILGGMLLQGYGRDSVVLALGGGVVGDMAGYTAGRLNRGVAVIQIPTTVLSQADSSVGGKTGVDFCIGRADYRRVIKNAVGLFYQPKADFIDIVTLETLPLEEVINGLAETIKHGVIRNRELFNYLENGGVDLVLRRDLNALKNIAIENCSTKLKVVQIDPNEKGMRRILNYGHTAGHAIESLGLSLCPRGLELSHGESVAIGMIVAGRISRDLGFFPQSDLDRLEQLLIRADLPVRIPHEIPNEDIIDLTTKDKKAAGGRARYCLPRKIGEMCEFDGVYATPVDNEVVLRALDETR